MVNLARREISGFRKSYGMSTLRIIAKLAFGFLVISHDYVSKDLVSFFTF